MTTIEWALIGGYFFIILGVGWYAGRGNKSGKDMHLGGRQTPWLAALISVVATEISAATLLGAPEAAFHGALFYIQIMLGSLVGRYVVAYLFVPAYYQAEVVTVYEFLEGRLGRTSRYLTAVLFLLNRMIADAVRLFIAGQTIQILFEVGLKTAVAVILVSTAVYVMHGGIKAVIWADVLQGTVFAGGGVFVLAGLLHALTAAGHPLGSLWGELLAAGKLNVINLGNLQTALTDAYSLQAAFLGGMILTLATHGTDHDMIQRVLTCKNSKDGARSLLGSGWVAMAVGVLFLLVGSTLWLTAQHGMFAAETGVSPMLTYLDNYASPAIRGVMTAAILAAAMGSLGSSLAASTATLTNDLLPVRWTDTLAKNRLAMAAIALNVWVLTFATATYKAAHPEIDLLKLALGALSLVCGTLLAFFVTALFTRARPGATRCVLAALVGVATGVSLLLYSSLAFEWRVVGGLLLTLLVLNLGAPREGTRSAQGERPEPPQQI